jgi:hypothetical protein
MKEHQWVVLEMFERHANDILRTSQTRMGIAHGAFGLERVLPEPLIYQIETCATVIVFVVTYPYRLTMLEHSAVLRDAVGDIRDKLGQMECGVSVVADTEQ